MLLQLSNLKNLFKIYFLSLFVFLAINATFYYLMDVKFYFIGYTIFILFNILYLIYLYYFQLTKNNFLFYTNSTLVFVFLGTFFYLKLSPHLITWHFSVGIVAYNITSRSYFYKWLFIVSLLTILNLIILKYNCFNYINNLDELSIVSDDYYFYFNMNTSIYTILILILTLKFITYSELFKNNDYKYFVFREEHEQENLPITKSITSIKNTTLAYSNLNPETVFDNEQIKNLFDKIKYSIEKEQKFLDSSLTLSSLALYLNSNSSYVSKAINQYADMNFNDFINQYRIDYFKSLLNNKDNDTFKVSYLSTISGFKNQSTFNKAFKKIENITPSDYLKLCYPQKNDSRF
ncbi:HTH araC/xylS-type domain-containing protein [Flavobacterium branchiophilum]|uniref:Probable transcriptional regulator, AraC family n=1 Tax=Flavobacterium branchiophilum (strain FL-15) TaxID=1034807 RepID=G2Z677_FLABF|nr:helix-turn-helix domain-containing protein [Flavobacterium branchiophilum]CCB70897.1 Probable transcriptional regulator, AraC family [Flavobacterium branchiophilum FL-15]